MKKKEKNFDTLEEKKKYIEIKEYTTYNKKDRAYIMKILSVSHKEYQALRDEKIYDELVQNNVGMQWEKHLFLKCKDLDTLNRLKKKVKRRLQDNRVLGMPNSSEEASTKKTHVCISRKVIAVTATNVNSCMLI